MTPVQFLEDSVAATITIKHKTDAYPVHTRPAAHIFVYDGALAWVEPSHLDPLGPAEPALHVVTLAGEPEFAGEARIFCPTTAEYDLYIDLFEDWREDFEYYAIRLRELNVTHEQMRNIVRAQIFENE